MINSFSTCSINDNEYNEVNSSSTPPVIRVAFQDPLPKEGEVVLEFFLPSRVQTGNDDDIFDSDDNICNTSFSNSNLKVSCAFANIVINDTLHAHTLIDTGANISAFSLGFYLRHRAIFGELSDLPEGVRYSCKAVNDSRLQPVGKVKFHFSLGTQIYQYECYVISDLKFDFIFGTDLILHVAGAVDIYYRQFFFGHPRQSIDIDIGIDEDIISGLMAIDPFISFLSVDRITIPKLSARHILVQPNSFLEPSTRYFIIGDDTEIRWVCPGEYHTDTSTNHMDAADTPIHNRGETTHTSNNVSASTINPPQPPYNIHPPHGQSPPTPPNPHLHSSNINNNSTDTTTSPSPIFLRVCNMSHETCVIEKGARVGLAVHSDLSEDIYSGPIDLGDWHTDSTQSSDIHDLSNFIISALDLSSPQILEDKDFELPHINLENTDLTPTQKEQLIQLLKSKLLAFSRDDEDLGLTDLVELVIDTGDAPPQFQRAYKCSYDQESWLEDKLRKWLDRQIIQHSNSPWAAPCSILKKKSGGYRLVIDYRRLNSVLRNVGMHWPLTLIDSCFDSLHGAKYFSALDINQAYEQVPVETSSIPKTSFVCKFGQFEFLRGPQGIKNMPGTFSKLADLMFTGLKWKVVNVFADDILIYSKTFPEHLIHIALVLDRIIAARVKLKLPKCTWAQFQVEYLGYLIGRDGIQPAPSKIESVLNYPLPRTPKRVHSFVCFCSYYRRFIKHFSTLTAPLNTLVNTKGKFSWTDECDRIFNFLKHALTSAPILIYPNFALPFFISTDASNVGLGAILFQLDSEGNERVISYASRTLNTAERNYSTTHKEGLAVVWAMTVKFHTYIHGPRQVTIITDHKPLVHLFQVKDPNGRLYRWCMKLEEYNYIIVYKPGKSHINVDVLSRIPEDVINSTIIGYDDDSDYSHTPYTSSYTSHASNPLTIFSLEHDNDAHTSHTNPHEKQVTTLDHFYDEYAPDWSFSLDLHLEQQTDPYTSTIIKGITEGSSPYDNYYIHSETSLLMHLFYPTSSRKHRDAFHQIVVTKSIQPYILRAYHDSPLSGHMSAERTYSKILRKYFWDSLRSDVFEHVRSCKPCSTGKTPRRHRPIAQGIYPPVWVPFQRISVDFLSLKSTTRGNSHLLVFIDNLTRWIEIFPTSDEQAETAAKILYDQIITRYGCPKELLSDNGSAFTSKIVTELCSIMNVKKLFITAHHPQANGMVERSNSTILTSLRSYCNDMGSDWDLYVTSVRFAINTIPNTMTGESPYYHVFGIDAPLPIDALNSSSPEFNFSDLTTYNQHLVHRLRRAWNTIAENYNKSLDKAQTHNTKIKGKLLSFQTGQKVWLYIPIIKKGYDRKLFHPWHGPYRIIDKISDTTYSILPCDGKKRKPFKIHVGRLKLYHERTIDIPQLPNAENFGEDPHTPPPSTLPDLPDRSERIIFEQPRYSYRKPTAQELSYLGKKFEDNGKCFEVTKCAYDKNYEEVVYKVVELHSHRNGTYTRKNKINEMSTAETQFHCDTFPL